MWEQKEESEFCRNMMRGVANNILDHDDSDNDDDGDVTDDDKDKDESSSKQHSEDSENV